MVIIISPTAVPFFLFTTCWSFIWIGLTFWTDTSAFHLKLILLHVIKLLVDGIHCLFQSGIYSCHCHQVDEGINCEIVRSVLMERANCPYLAAQTATEVRCYVPLTNPPQRFYSSSEYYIVFVVWTLADGSIFKNGHFSKSCWSVFKANKDHPWKRNWVCFGGTGLNMYTIINYEFSSNYSEVFTRN